MRQANQLAENNKFPSAAKLYRELLQEHPDSADVLVGLAHVSGDERERDELIGRAYAVDPEYTKELLKPNPPAAKEEAVTPAPSEQTKDAIEVQGLRCNRCAKPLTMKNLVQTSVGYRCKECVRALEDEKYFTAGAREYLIAALITLPLALIVSLLLGWLQFALLSFFLGSGAGTGIGRIAFQAIGRKRGRYLPYVVGSAFVLGCLLAILFSFFLPIYFSISSILIVAFLGTLSAFYQTK